MSDAAGVPEDEIRGFHKAVSKMNKSIKNLFTECKMSMIR